MSNQDIVVLYLKDLAPFFIFGIHVSKIYPINYSLLSFMGARKKIHVFFSGLYIIAFKRTQNTIYFKSEPLILKLVSVAFHIEVGYRRG